MFETLSGVNFIKNIFFEEENKNEKRSFIRAVTMSYDDLLKYGSEKAVREAGRLREEGKEYVGQDGDIMEFRFNV